MGAQDEVAQAWFGWGAVSPISSLLVADVAGRGVASLLLHTHVSNVVVVMEHPTTRSAGPRSASHLQLHLSISFASGMIAGYLHSTVPHNLLTQQPCPHAPVRAVRAGGYDDTAPLSGIWNR